MKFINQKMINNFAKLNELLYFQNKDDFYLIQILKRRKDNPNMDVDMRVVDNFFINSEDDFKKKEDRIIEVCNRENARAYLRVNKRNYKKVALQSLKKLTEYIISENYSAAKSAFLSAAGEFHSQENKIWIVDIDTKDENYISSVRDIISRCHCEINVTFGVLMEVPTVAGVHILCYPFNLQRFKSYYPDMDVHKDNPTLLYKS